MGSRVMLQFRQRKPSLLRAPEFLRLQRLVIPWVGFGKVIGRDYQSRRATALAVPATSAM